MRPIRAYLLIYSDEAGWESSVHRDLDELVEVWQVALNKGRRVGFVHVGLTRPPNKEFEAAAVGRMNCLLLSTSARWVFDSLGTYSTRIDSAGGLGLHLALTGWGYSGVASEVGVDAPEDVSGELIDCSESDLVGTLGADTNKNETWLPGLKSSNPNLYASASAAGVVSGEAYLKLESSLPWILRKALGLARTLLLMSGQDNSDAIALVHALPPWLLAANLEDLNLTVRCSNCFRAAGIVRVSELRNLKSSALLALPNFGRKSERDLSTSFWNHVKSGPPSNNDFYEPSEKQPELQPIESSRIRENTVGLSEATPSSSFKEAFESSLSGLPDDAARVVRMRIGIGQERMTLEEIGDEVGVTRERIRQVESKAIKHIKRNPVWESVLAPKLAGILDDREDSLPAASLSFFDLFFAGTEDMLKELNFIFTRILDDGFHVFKINGCDFITRISPEEWDTTVSQALNLAEQALEEKSTKTDFRQRVTGLLGEKGRELGSELWALVQGLVHFSADADGTERLTGAGTSTSAESLVAAVLATADRPLHYSEIAKRVAESFGRHLDIRMAHRAAANVGKLFGRGTYGTIQHCPLTIDEMAFLRNEVEEIILAGPKGRQWSCFELDRTLHELSEEVDEQVDRYIVDLALEGSKVLSRLGRMIWVQSGERAAGSADRIDVSQAILALLGIAGRPMNRKEIQHVLLHDRGLSSFFQIQPRGSLVKVDETRWGILERDIPLTKDELVELRDCVEMILEDSGRGLHLSETFEAIQPYFPKIDRIGSPHAVHGVLQVNSRFKASVGGYVYLASWGNARRLTVSDAVTEVFSNNPNCQLTNREITAKASEVLGRPVDKSLIYSVLRKIGARFDEASGFWSVPDTEDEEV